jgi:outer membrane protein assembly factor BamB
MLTLVTKVFRVIHGWLVGLSFTTALLPLAFGETAQWDRFRGPNGSGVSLDASPTPTTWSPDEHIRWKIDLPGPGSSSPIVVGDKVFVTCWSGYGTDESGSAGMSELKRHLLCIDRESGKIIWDKSVLAVLPEDNYQGMFAEHGYASHTPTSDGERVYAFFGKTGVIAFDMHGNEVWRKEVGDGLDERRWGSSSSPVLYKDTLFVTAAAESRSLIALEAKTGKEKWKQPADGFRSTWGTPILVKVDDQRTDLVIGVPFELWGFDTETGVLRWFYPNLETDSFCSSVVADETAIYAVEGRSGGSVAIKIGGKDDVSKTNVLWSGRDRGRIVTPVLYQDRLYFFSGGIANCIDAKTGKQVYQTRLRKSLAATSSPAGATDGGNEPSGERGNFGRRGGGGGPGGGQDYASPIIAGGMIYSQGRNGDVYVIQPGDELKQIAINRVSAETNEDFSATPAAAAGQLFIRSSKRLYCIGN